MNEEQRQELISRTREISAEIYKLNIEKITRETEENRRLFALQLEFQNILTVLLG